MKQIDIKKCHELLLELGKDFHRICSENGIKYYMLGGSMLGAVRHKGFIPWDDDMDFGIPRDDYEKFKNIAPNFLMTNHTLCLRGDNPYLCADTIKIMDNRTQIRIVQSTDEYSGGIGVFIDVFPLDETNMTWKTKLRYRLFTIVNAINYANRTEDSHRPFYKKVISKIIKAMPFINNKTMAIIDDALIKHQVKGDYFANYYGAWGLKEFVPKYIFGNPVLYDFEDTKFYGVEYPDNYLKLLYNDYMKMPPVEKQHIHLEGFEWK